jgi:hypothetical protein
MQTMQRRCGHCGFEIGEDGHACRVEPNLTPEARRAVRQVVGLDLPTRSVHPLPGARSRRERRPARPERRPAWASDLASFTTLLAVGALLAVGLGVVARIDRFAVQVPDRTPDVLGQVATGLAIAAVVGAVATVLAWAAHGIHLRRHRERPPVAPSAR